MNGIILAYQGRLAALHVTAAQLRVGQLVALAAVAIAVTAILVLGFFSVAKRAFPISYTLLPLAPAVYAGMFWRKRDAELHRVLRLKSYCERGISRLEGNWRGGGSGGEELSGREHCYDKDLNVTGVGSLFELLCTCRTEVGRRRLGEYLLEAPSLDIAKRRQEAVREFQDKTELREWVHLLGNFEFEQATWNTLTEWLETPLVKVNAWVRMVALVASLASATVLLAGFDGAVAWSRLVPSLCALLAVNGGLGCIFEPGCWVL